MWIKDACKISRTALHWKYKAFLQGNNSIHSTCYRASIYLVAYPPLYSGKVANKDSFILLTNDWLVLSWACKPVLQKEFGVFWKKRASLPIREKAYHWALSCLQVVSEAMAAVIHPWGETSSHTRIMGQKRWIALGSVTAWSSQSWKHWPWTYQVRYCDCYHLSHSWIDLSVAPKSILHT